MIEDNETVIFCLKLIGPKITAKRDASHFVSRFKYNAYTHGKNGVWRKRMINE